MKPVAQSKRDGDGMLTVDENWTIIVKHEVLATGTDNLFEIYQLKSHPRVLRYRNLKLTLSWVPRTSVPPPFVRATPD